jgi:type II secretory pathway predicted ATPase ExeA
LLGGTGCGKSLLLETCAHQLRRSGSEAFRISLFGINAHEFLWLVAEGLSLNPDRRTQTFELWRSITDRIAENRLEQRHTVLLLDDADDVSAEVLPCVIRLLQTEMAADARFTIVLALDATRTNRLSVRVLDLAELRIDLEPWEAADTADYIAGALRQAGRTTPAFAESALTKLHDLSGGVPRRINHLADLSLLAGAGKDLSLVDAETVETVHSELGINQPAAWPVTVV